jgi:hypothetical protein
MSLCAYTKTHVNTQHSYRPLRCGTSPNWRAFVAPIFPARRQCTAPRDLRQCIPHPAAQGMWAGVTPPTTFGHDNKFTKTWRARFPFPNIVVILGEGANTASTSFYEPTRQAPHIQTTTLTLAQKQAQGQPTVAHLHKERHGIALQCCCPP